jgi:hypothetical protein
MTFYRSDSGECARSAFGSIRVATPLRHRALVPFALFSWTLHCVQAARYFDTDFMMLTDTP